MRDMNSIYNHGHESGFVEEPHTQKVSVNALRLECLWWAFRARWSSFLRSFQQFVVAIIFSGYYTSCRGCDRLEVVGEWYVWFGRGWTCPWDHQCLCRACLNLHVSIELHVSVMSRLKRNDSGLHQIISRVCALVVSYQREQHTKSWFHVKNTIPRLRYLDSHSREIWQ